MLVQKVQKIILTCHHDVPWLHLKGVKVFEKLSKEKSEDQHCNGKVSLNVKLCQIFGHSAIAQLLIE